MHGALWLSAGALLLSVTHGGASLDNGQGDLGHPARCRGAVPLRGFKFDSVPNGGQAHFGSVCL